MLVAALCALVAMVGIHAALAQNSDLGNFTGEGNVGQTLDANTLETAVFSNVKFEAAAAAK